MDTPNNQVLDAVEEVSAPANFLPGGNTVAAPKPTAGVAPEPTPAPETPTETKAETPTPEAPKAEAEAVIREALGTATAGTIAGVTAVRVSARTRVSVSANDLKEADADLYNALAKVTDFTVLVTA
jgi:hypothetical protein